MAESTPTSTAVLDLFIIRFSSVGQVSTNFCSDGDLIHDFSAEWANRTNGSSLTDELESALQADAAADQRLNLSDMESQFPGVRFISSAFYFVIVA